MENIEKLTDEALEQAAGGAATNTTDWTGAHWQPTQYSMGSTFSLYGFKWYRIKPGDTLGEIAKKFGTSVDTLKANNPRTITNVNVIYAGDAIIIGRV